MVCSIRKKQWAAIARMNITLLRMAHVGYFPSLPLAEGLILRVMLQHTLLWEIEGRPATVSKLARALGTSRATTRRRIAMLLEYSHLKQVGRHYVCAEGVEKLQERDTFIERYSAVIGATYKELVNLATSPAVR